MREIRVALLGADVPLNIAKDFVEKVKKKAREKILKSVKPGDLVAKIVHDLVELLSFNPKNEDFELILNKSKYNFNGGTTGSGKTTTAANFSSQT